MLKQRFDHAVERAAQRSEWARLPKRRARLLAGLFIVYIGALFGATGYGLSALTSAKLAVSAVIAGVPWLEFAIFFALLSVDVRRAVRFGWLSTPAVIVIAVGAAIAIS